MKISSNYLRQTFFFLFCVNVYTNGRIIKKVRRQIKQISTERQYCIKSNNFLPVAALLLLLEGQNARSGYKIIPSGSVTTARITLNNFVRNFNSTEFQLHPDPNNSNTAPIENLHFFNTNTFKQKVPSYYTKNIYNFFDKNL